MLCEQNSKDEMDSYLQPLDAIEKGHKLGTVLGVAAFVGSVKSIDSTHTQINQQVQL